MKGNAAGISTALIKKEAKEKGSLHLSEIFIVESMIIEQISVYEHRIRLNKKKMDEFYNRINASRK